MRIEKNISLEIISWSRILWIDIINKNCMVDCEKNYKFDLGVKEFRDIFKNF